MLTVDPTTATALARAHALDLQADARTQTLARLAAACCPSALRRAARAARRALPRAASATVAWLRAGQLGPGYVRECCL